MVEVCFLSYELSTTGMYQTASNSPGQPWTYRVAEAGRKLWTNLLQTLPWPDSFWRAPGRRLNSFWAACANAPASTSAALLLVFRGNLLGCSFCPQPLVLTQSTTEKNLAASSVYSLQVLTGIDEISLSLVFTRLSSPSSWPLLTGQTFWTLSSEEMHMVIPAKFYSFGMYLPSFRLVLSHF